MTRNNHQENPNTFYSWVDGKLLALYAIGIAAGIFIYKVGVVQKITGKLFGKREK